MIVTEIEDIENIEQSLSCYGKALSFPVRVEDLIIDNCVTRHLFIGNKKIGTIIVGGGLWNVIEGQKSNVVPFVVLMDAIIYILKEEGYL